MRGFKRMLPLFLAAMMLVGCAGKPGQSGGESSSDQERFEQMVAELPGEILEPDDMGIQFLLIDPEKAGVETEPMKLKAASMDEFKEGAAETQLLLDELNTIDAAKLDEKHQGYLESIKESLERSLLTKDFYLFQNSDLGSSLGEQAGLPATLYEFRIKNEKDLNNYFSIIENLDASFQQFYQNELERQAGGVGMSQAVLDRVIKQCDTFFADERPFLIDAVNTKIDGLALDEQAKQQAKQRNEALCIGELREAYQKLSANLGSIQGDNEDKGLCDLPGGDDYYAALLKQNTTMDITPAQANSMLRKKMQTLIIDFLELYQANPDMDLENGKYSDFKTAEENLDYLKQAMKKDFPEVPDVGFRFTQVPDSMKDNISPAFYYLAPLDAPMDHKSSIWMNGEFDEGDWETIAHEGYPGHAYQDIYFRTLNIPHGVRLVSGGVGYKEGWANYTEGWSIEYVPAELTNVKAMRFNREVQMIAQAVADIGVHYEGWDKEETHKRLSELLNQELPREMSDNIFYLVLENPTNMLYYALPQIQFEKLSERAQKQLGDRFDSVDYHKFILDQGECGLEVLERRVERYIQTKLAQTEKAA